jgi:hypothetical protein
MFDRPYGRLPSPRRLPQYLWGVGHCFAWQATRPIVPLELLTDVLLLKFFFFFGWFRKYHLLFLSIYNK